MSLLLRDGPAVGVHFLCVDTDPARLPVEAGAVVQVQPGHPSRLTVEVRAAAAVKDVVPDAVSDRWAHRFARALARLRDATPDAGRPQVPDRARLLDVLAPDGLTPEDVAGRWRVQPRSTSALLGVAAAGPYTVDLRRDGPHVLVGGTTGSGKSELLQTLIASLALGNRPDEMVFVLVDYKGGSAFKECALLPHTAGLVTDLDGHLTARALASLEAELRRRERLLQHLGAKDIEDYQATAGAADARLPRLLLVIDEFKALAEELPDFLDGLVRIAAVGRSLGIHLVLATQRPGGIVSSDIKANVNLRIALRVRDTVDSIDVIDAPQAQAIPESTPGRAYARSGAQPLVLFQTARVGGRAHERGGLRRQRVPLVVGHRRGPTSSPTDPWRRQRPDRPGPGRRGDDPAPPASRASRAPLPRGSRHCRTSWSADTAPGRSVARALRPRRPAPPAGAAAGHLGSGERRPPGRGRGQPHGTHLLPAHAGRHHRHTPVPRRRPPLRVRRRRRRPARR